MKKAFGRYKDNKAAKKRVLEIENLEAAMILHGCGEKDGTNLVEAMTMMIALNHHNIKVTCFSPNKPLPNTVNHRSMTEEEKNKRNILQESSRIFGVPVKPI